MELSTILLALAVLVCPIVMGTMMWMMNKKMSGSQEQAGANHTNPDRLDALLKQRQELQKEIVQIENNPALNAEKKALDQPHSTR